MRNVLKLILLAIIPLYFSSCLSTGAYEREQVNIPFEGPMEAQFGYENIAWGTSYRKIKEGGVYPIIKDQYSQTTDKYYLGYITKTSSGNIYQTHYAHGYVYETQFFFTPDTKLLYQVTDTLSVRNPSLEYLHSRYGEFNEENVAIDEIKAKGGIVYSNRGCIEGVNKSTLIISINAYGKTSVTAYDPFAYATITKSPKFDDKYTNIKNDTWYCWASIDGNLKAVDYTIVQKNADNKWLILGYHKSLESPARSFVRAGFDWGLTSTSGKYEIKSGTDIVSYDFSSGNWECKIINEKFNYTKGEYRKMVNTFLSGEKLTVRRNDKVTEFNTVGLSKLLENKGITLDELDYAIANEEF